MEKLKGQAEAFCRKYLQCMDPDQAAAMAGCADGYAVLETKMVRRRLERMREDPAAGLGVAGGGLRPGVRGQPGHVPAGVSAMDDQLILKNRLKVARAEKGLSQTQLAELVGVSRNTISSIETGQFNPTAKLALILCIALDKKFEELFYFE